MRNQQIIYGALASAGLAIAGELAGNAYPAEAKALFWLGCILTLFFGGAYLLSVPRSKQRSIGQVRDQLLARLKQLHLPAANVKILIVNGGDFELGLLLESLFSAAGWNVNYTRTPQGGVAQGIEVRGKSMHLVSGVASALSEAELTKVFTKIHAHEISPENPKYPAAENNVRITIGHR